MFRLIRVRLALTYAGIALLVTLSLGAVLLVRLNTFYANMELDYLYSNARAMSALASPMLTGDYAKDVRDAQASNMAFLSQTRVRILGPQKNVLADSGPWQTAQVGMGVLQGRRVQISIGGESATRKANEPPASVIIVQSRQSSAVPDTIGLGGKSEAMSVPAQAQGQDSTVVAAGSDQPPNVLFFSSTVPISNGVYGMYLSKTSVDGSVRSNQTVLVPITDALGAMLGYVELSESPAYGREIVNSVASALAIAGGLAILLAVIAGWLTSSRLTAPLLNLTDATEQMSGGDLSVRVTEASRRDEIGALGKSFNQMAGRIEETVQTLRRFLSDAAHELQTPLTALRTNLELAKSEENNPGTEHYLNQALEQIDRLQRLIKDLLNLSRLESADNQAPFQPVGLTELIAQVSEPFAARAEQANQIFKLDLLSGEAMINGSPDKLRGALANLLDNALKFTPSGGAVTVSLREAQGMYCLTVSDTGIGIPPEEIGMLFNRFHRARNASPYPGSGLGLAIVRTIAQAHGGSVKASNNPDGGASFALCLPSARLE